MCSMVVNYICVSIMMNLQYSFVHGFTSLYRNLSHIILTTSNNILIHVINTNKEEP